MATAAPPRDRGYELCVVTFLDVLGFRSLLQTRTAEQIRSILTAIEDFTQPDSTQRPRSMSEVRLHSEAFAQTMSDAVVRVRTCDTQSRDGALFWEVLDLIHAQIDLMNAGVIVRGGLTVGEAHLGLDGSGPIFGPAVARAYEIESEEAVYPRIVVDDAALNAHRDDPRLRTEDEEDELYTLLKRAEDGTYFIDYLRAGENEFDDPADSFDFLNRHAVLIRRGLEEQTSLRVRRKYLWLARYHNEFVRAKVRQFRTNEALAAEFSTEYEFDPIAYLRDLLVPEQLL